LCSIHNRPFRYSLSVEPRDRWEGRRLGSQLSFWSAIRSVQALRLASSRKVIEGSFAISPDRRNVHEALGSLVLDPPGSRALLSRRLLARLITSVSEMKEEPREGSELAASIRESVNTAAVILSDQWGVASTQVRPTP
jgi:hypothetical protein